MHLPPISKRFAWLALAAAIAIYIVIVAGGIVRVTGSGLGCPDWPQCYGQWVPPLEGAILIEYAHRVAATAGSLLLVATSIIGLWRYRGVAWIGRPAALAVALLAVQIVLGGITVLLELPPTIVAAHLGVALLLLAMLLAEAVTAFYSHLPSPAAPAGAERGGQRYANHVLWTAVAVFGLLLTGATVAGAGATWACPGVPWCDQQLLAGQPLALLQMGHRTLAVVVTGLLAWLAGRAWGLRRDLPGVVVAAALAVGLGLTQIGVGVAGVLVYFPPSMQGLHLAVAALFWAAVVVLTVLARLGAERLAGATTVEPAGWPAAAAGGERRPGRSEPVVS